MNDYSVRGRVFRTGNDYQAALRDEKKIELILKRYENADKAGKEAVSCNYLKIRSQKGKEVLAYPSADHRVIRHDQNRNDRVHPSAELHQFTV